MSKLLEKRSIGDDTPSIWPSENCQRLTRMMKNVTSNELDINGEIFESYFNRKRRTPILPSYGTECSEFTQLYKHLNNNGGKIRMVLDNDIVTHIEMRIDVRKDEVIYKLS